jgi:hypothetical protein
MKGSQPAASSQGGTVFQIIGGTIEFVQGRTLSINGLEIEVPREGFAYIAAELFLLDGKLMSRVRELKGPNAGRFSFMGIGNDQFTAITSGIEKTGGRAVPFGFMTNTRRPKVTVN